MSRADSLGADILRAVGIDPSTVQSFTLQCVAHEVPTLTAQHLAVPQSPVTFERRYKVEELPETHQENA